MIQGNEVNDHSDLVPDQRLLKKSATVSPFEAASCILTAIRKHRKTNTKIEPFYGHVLNIAHEGLDRVLAQCEDLVFIKWTLKAFGHAYSFPLTNAKWDLLIRLVSLDRFLSKKAQIIQAHWKTALANPYTEIGKRRLLREFLELQDI